jgi:hypothetical protein
MCSSLRMGTFFCVVQRKWAVGNHSLSPSFFVSEKDVSCLSWGASLLKARGSYYIRSIGSSPASGCPLLTLHERTDFPFRTEGNENWGLSWRAKRLIITAYHHTALLSMVVYDEKDYNTLIPVIIIIIIIIINCYNIITPSSKPRKKQKL